MTSIWKDFHFDAAHWLPHVPEGHKCGRMHGHTYRVLNDVTGLENPTTEILAPWLFEQISVDLPQLFRIEVAESATTGCVYEQDGD